MTHPRPITITVTGSECTGKTTLVGRLASRFDAPWSREFAREYVDTKQAELDASDVEPIARGQLAGEQATEQSAREQESPLVLRDTDLFSTVVYSRYYYGACPGWVEQAAAERVADLYLLMTPDVPWVPDGLTRDRPDDAARAEIHRLFHDAILASGAPVLVIRGDWTAREAAATDAITGLLGEVASRRSRA